MSIPEITKEEIDEAIRDAVLKKFARKPYTYTISELSKKLGVSDDAAKRKGEQMVELGLADATKAKVIDKRGNLIDVTAFILKIPPKSPA